jgi:hypothetical protein
MKQETLCVAVSGLHLGENAQPGPGVIRSLRDALGSRLRVVGLAYDALDSSLYAPALLDESFILPYPSASPNAYLERLLEIDAEMGLDLIQLHQVGPLGRRVQRDNRVAHEIAVPVRLQPGEGLRGEPGR